MEELGASKLPRQSALSKSSEQLDHLWRYSTGSDGPDRDKRNDSFFAEVRKAQGQDSGMKKPSVTEQAAKEPELVGQKTTQGQMQNQTQKKSLLKQNSEPREDVTVGTRNSSRSTSPTPSSSSRARVQSGSHSPVTDEFRSSRSPSDTSSNSPSPRGQEYSDTEIKSTSSSPIQTKLPSENRPSSR